MNPEPKSAVLTWVYIGLSFFLPAYVWFSGSPLTCLGHDMVGIALYGLLVMAVVGIALGFCVRPDSERADLAVFGSPIMTVVIGFVATRSWEAFAYETSVLSALLLLCAEAVFLVFFATPTAGFVRATHWFRDRNA